MNPFNGDELRLPLFGEHNVSNALAAVALATHVLGSRRAAIDGMTDVQPIPRRLERIRTTLDVQVYVDCARTVESVETVLATIAAISGKRKRVAVLGCSGDSDRRKRTLMARAAAAGSDICILPSDNPNQEHPASIIRDMITGLRPSEQKAEVRAILDLEAAIEKAIELAMPDGVVVLLGKGTERFQLVEGKRFPHSDYAVAERVLNQLTRARLRSAPTAPRSPSVVATARG
jgi:UDP-N-acetylmuramoyl-L-alanyl-D-glutamate--2,6-diaminopimelate ligase